MKYFVFSDVHGCVDELRRALDEAGYDERNEGHRLLFLGDAFDKGRNDYETWVYLKEHVEAGKLIWVLGNHEDFLMTALQNMTCGRLTRSGVRKLAAGYNPAAKDWSDEECLALVKEKGVDAFLNEHCIDFYETEHYVFTHGYVPCNKAYAYRPDWRQAPRSAWRGVRMKNGMSIVLEGHRLEGKTLVCGHVGADFGYIARQHPELSFDSPAFNALRNQTKRAAKTDVEPFRTFRADGVIGLDGRSYDTGIVNVLVVDE